MANDFDDFQNSELNDQAERPKSSEQSQRRNFVNELNPFDTLTQANAYINEIRQHNDHIFVSMAILSGRRRREGSTDEYETVFQYVDVLAGRTLKRTFEILVGKYDKERGKIFGRAEIRNLVYSIGEANDDGKQWLNTMGILETFTIGHLDR